VGVQPEGLMITFKVAGLPVPQGSKSVNRSTGFMYEANKHLMPWRQEVIAQASRAHDGGPILGPVRIQLRFSFPRPKSHYGTGRNAAILKPNAPTEHSTKPDVDKCTRAILDALTIAGIWRDDAQACQLTASKSYSPHPGVTVTILTPEDDTGMPVELQAEVDEVEQLSLWSVG
jgi:Holliday junction resolvase RusA-like endonuclease